MSKGFASNYRIVVLAFGVLVSFLGVGTRLVFLHVIDREELVSYTDKARRQIIVENARRGDILDGRGNVLATSRSMIELGVDPQMLRKEDEKKWPLLAQLLEMRESDLRTILTTKFRTLSFDDIGEDPKISWAKLKDEISEQLYDRVTALEIKGVYGNRNYRRAYPHNQLAAHVIGFVTKEEEPKTGIERYADFYLRGQSGWRESEKDGRQREMAQFRTREVPATNGFSVVLSIDSVIQNWVEDELAEVGKKFNPQKATIIVSDARSGFLLALANYPTFNLNEIGKSPNEVLTNHAVASQLDPGSTFKIVAISGALNEGLVNLDSTINCSQDFVDYEGRHLRLMRDDDVWDHPISVREIVSKSSNRGAAQLAMKLGDDRFYKYARAFGFGELSGFPLGGEIDGALNEPKKWSGIDITRIPAGYSVSATPMQIHFGMATIASGGELFKPQVIREVRDASGENIYRFGAAVRRRVITPKTAEQVAIALEGVVSSKGTAGIAAIEGYEVAGKTGTAQKLINGHYSEHNHVGTFTGFFPASRPQVVITVIVDDGKVPGGGDAWGRVVAAPSFKRIAEQLIQYLDIKPVVEPNPPLLAMQGGHL